MVVQMNAFRLVALALLLALAAASVSAYHYAPYGGSSYSYERSHTSESVTSRESEYQSSSSGSCGWRYCHSTGSYDYGRSREFSFSRSSDYERETASNNYGYMPYGSYSRGYSNYEYPYYDVGTSYGTDYRPFSEYYHLGFTSPYYDPYRYSRVGAYASNYRPYGY
jgi:hypothetical protein